LTIAEEGDTLPVWEQPNSIIIWAQQRS